MTRVRERFITPVGHAFVGVCDRVKSASKSNEEARANGLGIGFVQL